MQPRKREEFAQWFHKSKFSKRWEAFMRFFYSIYMLVSFFSIIFGMVYVLYYSYYKFSLFHMLLGMSVSVFMVFLNTRSPK